MRHVLVSLKDPEAVGRLRDAADASTTFLPESGLEEALERLFRSSRIDAVITDDPELVAAIREEVPGTLPVHLTSDGETARESLVR
jgi:hypothetical protein